MPRTTVALNLNDTTTALNYLAGRYGNGMALVWDDGEWAFYPRGLDGERVVGDVLVDLLTIAVEYDLTA